MTARGRIIGRRVAIGVAWGLALAAGVDAVPGGGGGAPGTVWTWGENDFGQLGNGTTSSSSVRPAAVAGLSNVVEMEGGREHIVALTRPGQVFVWGSNVEGQLGLGGNTNRSVPTQVGVPCGAGGVAQVAAGHNSTLSRCTDGRVFAWGLNSDGQLGDGTRTVRRTPVQVQGVTDAVDVAIGPRHELCHPGQRHRARMGGQRVRRDRRRHTHRPADPRSRQRPHPGHQRGRRSRPRAGPARRRLRVGLRLEPVRPARRRYDDRSADPGPGAHRRASRSAPAPTTPTR